MARKVEARAPASGRRYTIAGAESDARKNRLALEKNSRPDGG
jgi:hypothetical protein